VRAVVLWGLAIALLFLLPSPLPGLGAIATGAGTGPAPASPLPPAVAELERSMGLTNVGALPYARPSPAGPAGTALYVSNTGSLSGSCTMAAPCRQISQALAIVAAGETIFVTSGTFLGFDVNGVNGSKAAPILIESPTRGSVLVPTLNRSDNRDTVHFLYAGNVTLDGFQAYDANRAAVRIDQSDNITVENCTSGDSAEWGIFTDFDHNSTIVHNTIYGTVGQHGIYVSNSPIAPVVRWNLLYDNNDAGLQINADATQGGWGEQSGGDIEDNVIYDNGAGGAAGINLDGNINTRVVNNLLYDNHATGIVNYANDGLFGPRGMTIMDNTIVMASNGRWALQFEDSTGENFVRNNILDNLNPAHGGLEFGTQEDVNDTSSDHNVLGSVTIDSSGNIYTLAQWQGMGYEPHSLSATPAQLFVDYTGGNYNLSATSPAIKAGEYLPNVTTDLSGNPRPVGPSDIGCYQYVSPILAAGAIANPLSGSEPLTVDFTGAATGGTSPYTYLWTYGDGGGPSHAQDPVHVYNASGTFPVVLAVTDAASAVAHAYLNVTVTSTPSPLVASASGSPLSGTAPLTVAFSGTASGGTGGYALLWTFGDGARYSQAGDPIHTFNTTGGFAVAFRVNDSAGASAWSNLTVSVSAAPPPMLTAYANASVQSGYVPLSVNFQGAASGGTAPYLYTWRFGDGGSSSQQDPTHVFVEIGIYTVRLWVTDPAEVNASASVGVVVSIAPVPPLELSISGPRSAATGASNEFEALAMGGSGGDRFSWNFEDGSGWSAPSSSSDVNYTFSSPGAFDVQVWTNDSAGGTARASLEVTISAAPCPCNNPSGSSSLPAEWLELLLLAGAGVAAVLVGVALALRRRRRREGPRSFPAGPAGSPGAGDAPPVTPPPQE
jgi:PKD repeat protein